MKLFRTLIVWLMLFAIPLQGYAAVTMSLCATGSPAPVAQVIDDDDQTVHQHHAAQAADAGHAMAADAQPSDSHCPSPEGTSKCSTCAACCVVAGNTHPVVTLATAKPVGSECIPYIAIFDTAHISTGLERPPHPNA
jgi:hypothetical protein